MREKFLIRLISDDDQETEIRLYSTRFQVDKVFYSLAFASNSGSYKSGELLSNGVVKTLLNRFEYKGAK